MCSHSLTVDWPGFGHVTATVGSSHRARLEDLMLCVGFDFEGDERERQRAREAHSLGELKECRRLGSGFAKSAKKKR